MPDLSPQGAHNFWKSFQDPNVYRAICSMECVEDWTLDGDEELENNINRLGDLLEKIGNIDLKQEDNLIQLGAFLKTGRILHILMSLDQAYPGAASKVLMRAENTCQSDKTADLFIKRNIVFERLRLLAKIFAPARLKLIKDALEASHD